MAAPAIVVKMLISSATSKTGTKIITYIIIVVMGFILFLIFLVAPPEDGSQESVNHVQAVTELSEKGIRGDISAGAIKSVYFMYSGDMPSSAKQISDFISSYFILTIVQKDKDGHETSYKRFCTKAEILDRVLLPPFSFDESQYALLNFAFSLDFSYITAPGNGTNPDGSDLVTPPVLSIKLGLPCEGNITSAWGWRQSPITAGEEELHTGMDIQGKWHQPLKAAYDGVVISANTVKSGYGNYIQIKHTVDGVTFYTFYAHMSRLDVATGQTVTKGQQIGLEGGDPIRDKNPGDSTGHHLHFEMRLKSSRNSTFDPYPYLY